MPQALKDQPEQADELEAWTESFFVLYSRAHEGRIALSDIYSYCDRHHVQDVEFFEAVMLHAERRMNKEIKADRDLKEQMGSGKRKRGNH